MILTMLKERLRKNRRIIIMMLLLIFLGGSVSHLQAQSRFWHKADSLLTLLRTNKADTMYLARPKTHWTLKMMGGVSNSSSYFSGRDHEDPLHGTYWSGSPRKVISLSANYRGLGLSVAVNPARLGSGLKALRFNVVTYSNKYGIDILYEHEGHLGGRRHFHMGFKEEAEWAGMNRKILTVSGYYVLSPKRFSYPAAFTQTWIQKKSAGSVLLGADLQVTNSNFDESTKVDFGMRSFDVRTISAGVGYGYNLVPQKRWLIHGSILPSLTIYSEKVVHHQTSNKVMDTYFPEFVLRSTLAVVNNYDRFFWGMNLMWVYSFNRLTEDTHFWDGRWRARALIGMRF